MCKMSGRVGEGHEQERCSLEPTCEDYDNGCADAPDLFTEIFMLSPFSLWAPVEISSKEDPSLWISKET